MQAKATICTSNIRQLSIALSTYVSEYNRFPYGFDNAPNNPHNPPEGGYASSNQFDRVGWWWFNYLKGFYKKTQKRQTVLNCPSKQVQNTQLQNDILCGNYGVNLSICKMSQGRRIMTDFIGEPMFLTEITRPSQTLLLVDSGYVIINWWHATDNPPVILGNSTIEDAAYIPGLSINRQRQLWPGQEIDAFYGRHPQKTVNAGFADGHVSRTKAEDLLVKKVAEDQYENRTPLWSPGSK
jgi:prepilin-type processing-associated H-X9-DG protein